MTYAASKKYEEYAYVLDFNTGGRSTVVRGRGGVIITAIGEDRLTLLEILGSRDSSFEIAERIYLGREGRTNVKAVLGKIEYGRMSDSARGELPAVVDAIVRANEARFVEHLNNAQALTSRIHALELIPGIGKTYTKVMLEEREKKRFESFDDLQERVGLRDPIEHISQRILEEVTGQTQMNLFVK